MRLLSRNTFSGLVRILLCGLLATGFAEAQTPSHRTFVRRAHEGFALTLQGRAAEAQSVFQEALNAEPERTELVYYLGESLATQNKWRQAVELLKRGVERTPEDVELLYALGAAYDALNEPENALNALRRVCGLDPFHARGHHLLGIQQARLGMFQEAVASLNRVLEWRPDDSGALYHLGRAYLGLKQPERAMEALEKAVSLDPTHPQSFFSLAQAYQSAGNREKAQEAMTRFQTLQVRSQEQERLTRASVHDPDNPKVWFDLARFHFESGRFRDAVTALRDALSRLPENAPLHELLSQAYLRLGLVAEAKNEAVAAIRLDPSVASFYNTLGFCSMRESRPDMAAEAFRQAIRVGGDVPAFHLNLSYALAALGDAQGSARHQAIYERLTRPQAENRPDSMRR